MSRDYDKLNARFREQLSDGAEKFDQKKLAEHRARSAAEGTAKDVIKTSPSKVGLVVPRAGGHNKLVGRCAREQWFQKHGAIQTNPPSLKSRRRMNYGSVIEAQEHAYADEAGLTVVHNQRMKVTFSSDPVFVLTGEVDSILKNPDTGEKYIYECKSFYGYYARQQIMGAQFVRKANIVGEPKHDHLIQVTQYLAMADEMGLDDIKYALIFYVDRTDCDDATFIVELHKDDAGDFYPLVNGRPYKQYSVRNIMARHVRLCHFFKEDNALPPRDCEYTYSEQKIHDLYEAKEISQKAFKDWQSSGKVIGDYQCSYCNFKTLCLGRFPERPETHPADPVILESLHDKTKKPATEIPEGEWDALLGG